VIDFGNNIVRDFIEKSIGGYGIIRARRLIESRAYNE